MIKNSESGFTIIELLVTIVVLGIIVGGITNLFITVENTQRRTYHLETATRAGERQIESLRNSHYSALVPGDDIDFTSELPDDLPSPNSGIVVVTEPIDGLRRVDVTITYKNGPSDKSVVLSSMIGILGIAQ